MTFTEIIDRVKSLLDEQTPFDSGLLVDTQEKPINTLIEACLSPAWKGIVMAAPIHLLPHQTASGETGSQTVEIPAGFIRFLSIGCESWQAKAYVYYEPQSKQALKQKYTSTAATISKPIIVAQEGAFKAYPAPTALNKLTLAYVPALVFNPDTIGDIVEDVIADPFCYNVAALVYAILMQKDLHDIMLEKRDALLS